MAKTQHKEISQEDINQECYYCEKIACSETCFNKHVGSMIALQKLLDHIEREDGIKTYLCG